MTSVRAMLTPIENFVNTSTEDVDGPGALKRAKATTSAAGVDLDAAVKKFST